MEPHQPLLFLFVSWRIFLAFCLSDGIVSLDHLCLWRCYPRLSPCNSKCCLRKMTVDANDCGMVRDLRPSKFHLQVTCRHGRCDIPICQLSPIVRPASPMATFIAISKPALSHLRHIPNGLSTVRLGHHAVRRLCDRLILPLVEYSSQYWFSPRDCVLWAIKSST